VLKEKNQGYFYLYHFVSILDVIGQVLFWGAIIMGIAKFTGKIDKNAEQFKKITQ